MTAEWIAADWPAPIWIKAGTSTRNGGMSTGAYASLNIGDHVDDDPTAVAHNRGHLVDTLNLPNPPAWLNQVHGNRVVMLERSPEQVITADGSITSTHGVVCAVMTADCLPVLLCHPQSGTIAALHCGWRGLYSNIIAQALQQFPDPHHEILAWLGPAICVDCYQVDSAVVAPFLTEHPYTKSAFSADEADHWQASLSHIARLQLQRAGIAQIYGGEFCTACDAKHFFSYRRDGGTTGRVVSLIWAR